MVVPLGKGMGGAVLLDKVCHWSVEFTAPSHFQFTLLCPTPATCRHSSPTIPAEELEAKISSFSKLQWSWCFIIATESYQSTDMNISPFISTFILAALYGLQCTSLFSSIAKLIPILLILKLFYPQFECLFSFNCSG